MTMRSLLLVLVFALPAAAEREQTPVCENDRFRIDADFASGDLDKCKFKSPNSVELTFRPEDFKVDDAFSWFSFRVNSSASQQLDIRLRFPKSYPRFWPKLSTDGVTWTRAPESTVESSGKDMYLTVSPNERPLWISAQELLATEWYAEWLAELNAHAELTVASIGESVEGRSIDIAKTGNKKEAIILIGRQHPTEIPGAIAMRDFVDVVISDSELARQFRERFTLLILPLVNPDGVANGHSRHNSGRTDLNRDWGSFKQPETRAIAGLLSAMEELEMNPRLMLDFHATKFTKTLMFYTQTAEEVTDPPNFAVNWFAATRERLPEFDFKHDPRPSQENPNTKGFFYRHYGIPAYTYELGDEADRELIHQTTPVFAEEMMRELLRAEPL
ncbi:MAG: M14-type cytosolic carboxypeptidase [Woeseiaceae bacterium]